jgi:hypothetical protein
VIIAADRHAGHVEGMFPGPVALDLAPRLVRESNVTGLSLDLPHHFPGGYFHLRSDDDLVRARHARRTAAGELARTKTSQYCELERREFSWTLYHCEPSQQGLGEGWAGMA